MPRGQTRDISQLPDVEREEILRTRAMARDAYHRNRERYRKNALERFRANRAIGVQRATNYRNGNKDKVNAYRRKRATEQRKDPLNRVVAVLRSRVSQAMTRGSNRPGSAVRDLGCTYQELREYLEGLFDPGMTWENYGRGDGKWHIDHTIPLAFFDLSNREQFLNAVHYTNLQPKWGVDNMKKGAKLELPSLF